MSGAEGGSRGLGHRRGRTARAERARASYPREVLGSALVHRFALGKKLSMLFSALALARARLMV